MLYHLIYVSKATTPLSGEALNYLLKQARMWNESAHITGMLLYIERHVMSQISGRFIQVIEGEESKVKLIFEKIKADQRHHQITVLQEGAIHQRSFNDWVMGLKVLGWQEYTDHPGYLDIDELFSNGQISLSPGAALNFMQSFYAI